MTKPEGSVLKIVLVGALCSVAACAESNDLACSPPAQPETRVSPYDSAMTIVGPHAAKLCYSRPSVGNRQIFGALVPYDTLWRTGANEPTILHLTGAAEIAGIRVEPGDYSIYTVPSEDQWTIVVNASTSQWGLTRAERGPQGNLFPNAYTDEVRSQEVGRAPIETQIIDFTEQLTAHFAPPRGQEVDLYLDWETTRIIAPIRMLPDVP